METPELLWQNLVRESVREVRYGMRSEVPGIIRLVDQIRAAIIAGEFDELRDHVLGRYYRG